MCELSSSTIFLFTFILNGVYPSATTHVSPRRCTYWPLKFPRYNGTNYSEMHYSWKPDSRRIWSNSNEVMRIRLAKQNWFFQRFLRNGNRDWIIFSLSNFCIGVFEAFLLHANRFKVKLSWILKASVSSNIEFQESLACKTEILGCKIRAWDRLLSVVHCMPTKVIPFCVLRWRKCHI